MSKKPHIRPAWDEYGLKIAAIAAERADCTRRQVGAALMLSDHSIAGTAYNGGPSGGPSCLKGECPRGRLSHKELPPDSDYSSGSGKCVALHAEWNLLMRAPWHQLDGSTVYITDEPCHICWNMLKGSKVLRVVWPKGIWVRRNTDWRHPYSSNRREKS